jgi:hypothetical protein
VRPGQDCELFGLDPSSGPPTYFLWQVLPVPPVAIRPSVAMDTAVGSNEDDLTIKLMDIVYINALLQQAMERGVQTQTVMEYWDFLQLQCAMYVNSELPGVPLAMQVRPPADACAHVSVSEARSLNDAEEQPPIHTKMQCHGPLGRTLRCMRILTIAPPHPTPAGTRQANPRPVPAAQGQNGPFPRKPVWQARRLFVAYRHLA